MKYISVIPAYGRDYQTEEQVKQAWESGSDFFITDIRNKIGHYLSIRDLGPNESVSIRYDKARKVTILPGK